jgi:hypothetical protein
MGRVLWMCIGLALLAGCETEKPAAPPGPPPSTARTEESSVALGDKGAKWAVVSFRRVGDQPDARGLMEQYCAPAGYRIATSDRHEVGVEPYGWRYGGAELVMRTYVRFTCE